MEENTTPMTPEEQKELRSGKIFFLVFGLILAGSVFATYYRMMIQKDYIIEAQVECDPMEKACFVWECDPTSTVEGEACTGDPENDVWYYALAKRKAFHIPLCDPATDETCLPMLCEPNEEDCEEIFCNEENKLEQEVECNDPAQYLLANPPEEEGEEELTEEIECEEGDMECLSTSAEAGSEEATPADETETSSDEVSEPLEQTVPSANEPTQPVNEATIPTEKTL